MRRNIGAEGAVREVGRVHRNRVQEEQLGAGADAQAAAGVDLVLRVVCGHGLFAVVNAVQQQLAAAQIQGVQICAKAVQPLQIGLAAQGQAGHGVVVAVQLLHIDHAHVERRQGVSVADKLSQRGKAIQVQLCQGVVEHLRMGQPGVRGQVHAGQAGRSVQHEEGHSGQVFHSLNRGIIRILRAEAVRCGDFRIAEPAALIRVKSVCNDRTEVLIREVSGVDAQLLGIEVDIARVRQAAVPVCADADLLPLGGGTVKVYMTVGRCQRGAVGKGAFADPGHRNGDTDFIQQGVIQEKLTMDPREPFREPYLFQVVAVLEYAGADVFNAVRQVEDFQIAAVLEGIIEDGRDTVRQHEIFEAGAVCEGPVADLRHRVGDIDGAQIREIPEGIFADAGHAGFNAQGSDHVLVVRVPGGDGVAGIIGNGRIFSVPHQVVIQPYAQQALVIHAPGQVAGQLSHVGLGVPGGAEQRLVIGADGDAVPIVR